MDKVTRLKIAAMILFWFGVIFQFSAIISYSREINIHGTIQGAPVDIIFSNWFLVLVNIPNLLFAHVAHIIAGYLLAKGKKVGAVAGIAVVFYETVLFIAITPQNVFSADGIGFRILFVILGILIVSGRKELVNLKSENWKPWKNPLTRFN